MLGTIDGLVRRGLLNLSPDLGAPEPRYVPLQARIGDYAIFFRRAAVEITFEGDRYLVVPQAAILTLVREEDDQDDALSF